MREILFRGKRVDNGDWVEGYFIGALTNAHKSVICNIIDGKIYPVHPKSVGQFTGLLDKNGKKIFEGDVLEDINSQSKGIVSWNNDSASFEIDYQVEVFDLNGISEYAEIIGNTHDNPEILKQTDNGNT